MINCRFKQSLPLEFEVVDWFSWQVFHWSVLNIPSRHCRMHSSKLNSPLFQMNLKLHKIVLDNRVSEPIAKQFVSRGKSFLKIANVIFVISKSHDYFCYFILWWFCDFCMWFFCDFKEDVRKKSVICPSSCLIYSGFSTRASRIQFRKLDGFCNI